MVSFENYSDQQFVDLLFEEPQFLSCPQECNGEIQLTENEVQILAEFTAKMEIGGADKLEEKTQHTTRIEIPVEDCLQVEDLMGNEMFYENEFRVPSFADGEVLKDFGFQVHGAIEERQFTEGTEDCIREKIDSNKRKQPSNDSSSNAPFVKKVRQDQTRKRSNGSAEQKSVKKRNRKMPSTNLPSLIDRGIVSVGQMASYKKTIGGSVLKEGRITREGIECKCCGRVYNISSFEAHAGSSHHRPANNIFLENGVSLIQCQMQMVKKANDTKKL